MQRVLIIGCPGAGKSHFSRWLRDKTKLPLYYLDQIWHRPDKTTIGREAFDQRLRVLLEKDRWIIDGNYIRTLELRLQACDTVFLLDLPAAFCLQSTEARIGQRREDLPWTEEAGEELDEAFREFILNFPRDTLPQIYRLLEQYQDGREITIFKSREAVNEYIRSHSARPAFDRNPPQGGESFGHNNGNNAIYLCNKYNFRIDVWGRFPHFDSCAAGRNPLYWPQLRTKRTGAVPGEPLPKPFSKHK